MMPIKRVFASLILAGIVASEDSPGSQQIPLQELQETVCKPSTFSLPSLGIGVQLTSVEAETKRLPIAPGQDLNSRTLEYCQVKVHINHEGTADDVLIEVWLPLAHHEWNGRFLATGGGGLATGMFDVSLEPAVRDGYAASSTDGGHTRDHTDASWALQQDGSTDWNLLHNFATRSIVEQISVSKAVTEQFYKRKPHHSYWSGCSQGGRQGYMLAQQYPDLVDGILANAPAIGLTKLLVAEFWPQLVMKEEGRWMSNCEFSYFRQKAMESCDMIDGVSDGVISELDQCDFDPLHLVGQVFYCEDDEEVEVTESMANIVRRIQEGPRTPLKKPIWHGLVPGTDFKGIADTGIASTGARMSKPFIISSAFLRNFVLKENSFNLTQLNYAGYMALWAQATSEFGWLLDSEDADLTALKSSGAKLLSWHGTSDPLIPYQNTVEYRKRVEMLMGGANEVDKFYRLFLAPGVEHCHGGNGPAPKDALAALVDWVEDDNAPETLDAVSTTYDGELVTRELCAWPGNAKYQGIADAKRFSSWTCVGGTERSESREFQEQADLDTGRAGQILGGLAERLQGLGMGLTIG